MHGQEVTRWANLPRTVCIGHMSQIEVIFLLKDAVTSQLVAQITHIQLSFIVPRLIISLSLHEASGAVDRLHVSNVSIKLTIWGLLKEKHSQMMHVSCVKCFFCSCAKSESLTNCPDWHLISLFCATPCTGSLLPNSLCPLELDEVGR